jgi:hypothetical protein
MKDKKDQSVVRSIINPEFMGMSPAEMNEFDGMIDKLEKESLRKLEKADVRKNDAYLKDDIVETEKGGEST